MHLKDLKIKSLRWNITPSHPKSMRWENCAISVISLCGILPPPAMGLDPDIRQKVQQLHLTKINLSTCTLGHLEFLKDNNFSIFTLPIE